MNTAPIRCLRLRIALVGPDAPAAFADFSRRLVQPGPRPAQATGAAPAPHPTACR